MPKRAILYIEDEESDIFLVRMAFKKGKIDVPLKTVRDGEAALHYLRGTGEYANRQEYPLPGLILLDLNIPRLHGLKVLKWIREQPALAKLPVVVFTSSEQPKDIAAAQELGANDYQVKPSSIELIAETIKLLIQRWLFQER